MHELACPSCGTSSQFDMADHLLMCPSCSSTFHHDRDTGQKDIYQDHYIIANTSTAAQVKELVLEWLARLDHRQGNLEGEYFVTNINGLSIPFWVVSAEAHSVWKGLVKRQHRPRLDLHPGAEYLIEQGQFKRNYRWAVSARQNLFEIWCLNKLHEPKESLEVRWDGFPLDSTFSRGQLRPAKAERTAYESRDFFEFKFGNGLGIAGIQITEEEALRRARLHIEQYHLEIARSGVDQLTDYRTEIEVAGIQLVHLPFWHATYVYRPKSALRHFYRPREKNVLVEGYESGVLAGELPIINKDKMWVNAVTCALASVLFFMLGMLWHGAFLLVGLFAAAIAAVSGYLAVVRQAEADAKATFAS